MPEALRGRSSSPRSDLLAMLGLLAGAAVVLATWAWVGGERIDVAGGAGFDGSTYADVVAHPGQVFDGSMNLHRFQRIVPCLLGWLVLRPFGLNHQTDAVVAVFQVFNVAALMGSVALLWDLARRLGLSRAAAWVGFLAVAVNYPGLKLSFFYPVVTDRFGLLLGMATVWAMVVGRTWLLPVLALVGAFTWPSVTYAALVAFVLSARVGPPPRPHAVWGIAASLVATAVVAVGSFRAHACGVPCVSTWMQGALIDSLYPLSLLLVALWTFLALQPLAARLTPLTAVRSVVWWRLALSVVLLLVVSRLQHAGSHLNDFTLGRTLQNTFLGGAVKPLGFLVTHATYYGPAVLLLVLTWRTAVRRMAAFGPAMLALLIVFVVLGVTTESRILVNEWPFFALAAALVADELRWGSRPVWVFGALCAVVSRAWLPIHHGQISMRWREYPSQWYFMSNGPTTTPLSYVLLALLALASGWCVWWLLRTRRWAPAAPVPGGVAAAVAPYPR